MTSHIDELNQIAAGAAVKDRPQLYRQLLDSVLAAHCGSGHRVITPDLVKTLEAFLSRAIEESLGLVASRQLLQDFVNAFSDWASGAGDESAAVEDLDSVLSVWNDALEKMQTRAVAFEEPISTCRERISAIYQEQEEWTEAARALQGIPLDSGHRAVSDFYRLRIYIKIVQLFLEDEDSVNAEAYLNRAALLASNTPQSPTTEHTVLLLQLKASQARLLDFKRQFIQAAGKYHELSYVGGMDETERYICLLQAVTCGVLAPAGPQRSRLLATLYKDERVREFLANGRSALGTGADELSQRAAVAFSMLEKMYMGRVLRLNEVSDFAATLRAHQLARVADPFAAEGGSAPVVTTVLDRAVAEHNLLAATRIYNNISFGELGSLLGTDAVRAERAARDMISEGRMSGTIDQIEEMIYFRPQKALPHWDAQIAGLCHHLDDVIDLIQKRHPDWVAAHS
ncbi:hypothetical protein DFJ73DRAFT_663167 [Zopfochytrium polystomum]|nr:hypothetical protein DFJ73DRAFT_663167 [Zopfochytrium polystomum]